MAGYEQHVGLTHIYVSCFMVIIGKKWSFDYYVQCSHGQIAFCSYILSNLWKKKKKTSFVHVQLLSGIGNGSSAILEDKNVHTYIHTMHFSFVFKLLFEKRGGENFGDHYFPSGDQNLYLIASWRLY